MPVATPIHICAFCASCVCARGPVWIVTRSHRSREYGPFLRLARPILAEERKLLGHLHYMNDELAKLAERLADGCVKIFSETASGVVTDRKALAKALGAMGEGDTLVVVRLDRLARSTRDLLNTLHAVASKRAGFKSLADAWCETTTPHGRLMLVVLGGLAEFERELICAYCRRTQAR